MTSRRLLIGPVPDDFDPVRDIPLSPSCFVGREEVFAGWEDLPFQDPFATPDEKAGAFRDARALANAVIVTLSDRLNKRHGTSYGFDYWREVLILWVLLLIQASWGRWKQIERAVALHGHETLVVEVSATEPDWSFADVDDFYQNGIRHRALPAWIDAECLRAMAPAPWVLVATDPAYDKRDLADVRRPPESTTRLKQALKRRLGRLSFSDIPGVNLGRIPLSLFISLCCRGKPFRKGPPAGGATPPAGFPAAYLDLLWRLLDSTMPESYRGQLFREWNDNARRLAYHPGRLMVTCATKYNDQYKFILAHAKENGERLVRVQHGGNTGTALVQFGAEVDYGDYGYFSWGWREHGDDKGPRIVPMAAPALAHLKDRHRFRDGRLLFIGTQMDLTPTYFKDRPQPAGIVRYRRNKLRFLEGLSLEVKAQTWYRPNNRVDSDLEELSYVARALPDMKVLEGSLHTAMLDCRLAVIDHSGSTMNAAFAANVPTVCTWDADAWPPCAQAKPFFDDLIAAGVLFHDPRKAAAHVNAIWPDVEGWWRSTEVQKARRAWARQFARSSGWWWAEWLRAMWTL
jgi:putative transferase (TIGR04331 family)